MNLTDRYRRWRARRRHRADQRATERLRALLDMMESDLRRRADQRDT